MMTIQNNEDLRRMVVQFSLERRELLEAWLEYKAFLIKKYPPQKGDEFTFSCPHHQKIDTILQKEIII